MMNPSRVRRMVALLGILAASDPSGALLAGEYELVIEEKPMNVTGREKRVPQINGLSLIHISEPTRPY